MLKHTQELLNGQPSTPADLAWYSKKLKAAYKLAASRMPANALIDPSKPNEKAARAHAIWSKALNAKLAMNLANGAFWVPRSLWVQTRGEQFLTHVVLYRDYMMDRYLVKPI